MLSPAIEEILTEPIPGLEMFCLYRVAGSQYHHFGNVRDCGYISGRFSGLDLLACMPYEYEARATIFRYCHETRTKFRNLIVYNLTPAMLNHIKEYMWLSRQAYGLRTLTPLYPECSPVTFQLFEECLDRLFGPHDPWGPEPRTLPSQTRWVVSSAPTATEILRGKRCRGLAGLSS